MRVIDLRDGAREALEATRQELRWLAEPTGVNALATVLQLQIAAASGDAAATREAMRQLLEGPSPGRGIGPAGSSPTLSRAVPRLSATPGVMRTPAPKLGEHSAEILGRVGVGPVDLAKLRSQGIV